jgi:mono/diheme cytochrome c family protein
MKVTLSGLCAAALLGAAVSAQAPTPSSTPPAAPAAANLQQGHELYLKYSCYACHGYDGHGGAGARLVPISLSVTRFTAYVRNPRRMPPYTDKVLSDAQLADLFAYIKSLPTSPSADRIPLLTRILEERVSGK